MLPVGNIQCSAGHGGQAGGAAGHDGVSGCRRDAFTR